MQEDSATLLHPPGESILRDKTSLTRPTELPLSLLARRLAPLAARGPAPGRACAPVSAPLQPGRRPCRALSSLRLMPEKGYVVAGAADSAALRSHFGARLEDHGPNVVL